MKNKKAALQLPLNMLVVIILAVVIFSMGVYLLYTIYGKSVAWKEMTDEQLDKQIEAVLCDKPVCLATTYKKIFRGEFKVIGLRIYSNIQDPESFRITADLNKVFNKTNDEITSIAQDKINILPRERTIYLDAKKETSMGIGIEVEKNAPSGTYVINVGVETLSDGERYGGPQQLRIEVP
jgi:hypothetical protein